MFKQLFAAFIVLCCFSFNVVAMKGDNPFAKNEVINIGKDINWRIDKSSGQASKTVSDDNGSYYHLYFDNKQLRLSISKDVAGARAKSFNQLEVKDVRIDGKQVPLFKWCLKNQERHNRFLQQGLMVKKDICVINGENGTFIMRLNKETLVSLQTADSLLIMLKPFRKPLELDYDISDFSVMQAQLNSVPEKPAAVVAVAAPAPVAKVVEKCLVKPPSAYKKIKPLEYTCSDVSSKMQAERKMAAKVDKEKEKQNKLAAEKEKQRKLAEQKKQEELALKLEQEKLLAAEAVAIAASEAKQTELNNEITQKMLKVCRKYWDKGEHRCYCQKYIEHAPASIQASSTCK